MKVRFIILWGSIMMLNADILQAAEININVTGIDIKRGGHIIVMIFGENGFPKNHEKALMVQKEDVLQKEMIFTFDLSIQEMAVKVLHDENKDGKVSKNWTGIYPKEGLGFSNGQRVSMTGPPLYIKSKLSRDQFHSGLNISMRYP